MLGLSFSELILVGILFLIVVTGSKIGKLATRLAYATSRVSSPKKNDPRMSVRENNSRNDPT